MQNMPVKGMLIVFTFVSFPLISFYERHLGVLLILSGRQGARSSSITCNAIMEDEVTMVEPSDLRTYRGR